eukprot:4112273-Alexandrium_andersonii.AAC.1
MLVLFGLPDTLHPAYLSAFNAVSPDVCRITNRAPAEILVCAKPSCNIWRETRILGIAGIWGIKDVNAGLKGTALRWATASGCLARGILRMGVDGAAKKLGEAIVQTFSAAPLAAVFISSGL